MKYIQNGIRNLDCITEARKKMMNRAEPGAQYRALAIHNAADAGQTVELAQLVAAAGGVVDVWVGKLKRTALMKACHRVSESNRAHNIHLAGVLDSGGYSSPGWGSIARLNDGVLSHQCDDVALTMLYAGSS